MHSPQNKITTSKVKWDVKLFPETILTSGVVKSTITGGKTIAYTDEYHNNKCFYTEPKIKSRVVRLPPCTHQLEVVT